MKTTVEKLSPTRAKLTISVTPEELKPVINHAYSHIAEQVNIPGFRKGKVPPPIIDQRVGKAAVLEHAVNEGLDGFYRAGRRGERRAPPRPPRGRHHRVAQREGLLGRPAAHHRGRRAPRGRRCPTSTASTSRSTPSRSRDDDVEEELDRLRSRFGTLITVDRPAKTGDFAQIDLVATIGGEEVDTAANISYEIGSGELIEGIDEALDTLTAGETTTFEAPLHGRRPRGRERADHRHRQRRQGARAPGGRRRLRPDRQRVRHHRRAARRACARRSSAPRPSARARPGARPARRQAPRARRDPGSRSSSSRTRCTVTSSRRTASRTTCTAPRSPSRARRPSARRSCSTRSPRPKRSRSARTSSPSTSSRVPPSTAWTRTSSSRSSARTARSRRWSERSPATRPSRSSSARRRSSTATASRSTWPSSPPSPRRPTTRQTTRSPPRPTRPPRHAEAADEAPPPRRSRRRRLRQEEGRRQEGRRREAGPRLTRRSSSRVDARRAVGPSLSCRRGAR